MPGKTPNGNGKEPVENGGYPGSKDIDMKDESSSSLKGKGKKGAKDGDEEMTVVVPISKKQSSAQPPNDADGDVSMDDADKDGEEKVDPVAQAVSDVKSNFALLDRAVALFDARFTLRALRSVSSIRKRLTPDILAQVIVETFPATVTSGNVAKQLLIALGKEHLPLGQQSAADSAMDVDSKTLAKNGGKKEIKEVIPEIDIFLGILVQVHLFDSKQFQHGAEFSSYLSDRIRTLNRRTLDSLSAKVYFYYSLFCENIAPLPPSPQSPIVALRPTLLAALRTAVLRKDIDIQASVIVLLLRNYLLMSHISQADLLVSHTQFPENAANNQVARFLYYLGRIRAIQLRYTEAHEHLTAATRKAPSSLCALGFSQTATKLLMVVELLMGDIPDRATFRVASTEQALHPYFLLVQAVRVGNLEDFETTIADHADTFRRDGTYTLILRLRQNVIKTGIRMMSLSYSRISLRDICIRLHLGSEESAEYIVAKAIRDGVIEATLDREHGFMKSKETGDIYATREPTEAFHDRIRACLALHDESVKVRSSVHTSLTRYHNANEPVNQAMRFPMNQHRLELKNAQEAREREREMANDIQEGDLDDDDLGGDFDGI
ncbi:26S proteasome non-ATPase regulatory subunit [Diaporthe eres]